MTILDTIVKQKQEEIKRLPEESYSINDLIAAVQKQGGVRDFYKALKNPSRGDIALIAEVKKASPSAGIICADFDPVKIAKCYETAGASCISVLTDIKFFQGSPEYLWLIRKEVNLPLLRKDFIIDERQIYESIKLGADAILLIVSILDFEMLKHFHNLIISAGLNALVEVHNEEELDAAISIKAKIIGINNRDLKTFKVDIGTTERLSKKIRNLPGGDEILIVAESGIKNREDVLRLKQAGANAILVGESLLRTSSLEENVRKLIG
ncbi:MAG TPA: indole-3-glycerol phosphate synthase TrpC [Verrucomicrobiota bacterium]|nr:indole-3-glycerol phosphate synthase TrpC [Verrucomicrobiota bacterium]